VSSLSSCTASCCCCCCCRLRRGGGGGSAGTATQESGGLWHTLPSPSRGLTGCWHALATPVPPVLTQPTPSAPTSHPDQYALSDRHHHLIAGSMPQPGGHAACSISHNKLLSLPACSCLCKQRPGVATRHGLFGGYLVGGQDAHAVQQSQCWMCDANDHRWDSRCSFVMSKKSSKNAPCRALSAPSAHHNAAAMSTKRSASPSPDAVAVPS
jgi:hypothetical protein